jgi:hypothetical protein
MNYKALNHTPIALSPFIRNDSLPKIQLQIKNFSLSLDEINSLYNNMAEPLKRESLFNYPRQKISMNATTRSRFYKNINSNLLQSYSNKSSVPITKSTFHLSSDNKSLRHRKRNSFNECNCVDIYNNNSSTIKSKVNNKKQKKSECLDIIRKKVIYKGNVNSRNHMQSSKSFCYKMKKFIDNEKLKAMNLKYYIKKEEDSNTVKIISNQYDLSKQRYSFFPSV